MAQQVEKGSPALAGIDRMFVDGHFIMHWFPRTRGDRPADAQRIQHSYEVPPHSRG